MANWSRANALLAVDSSLGTDALIPISMTVTESISQPFQCDILAACQTGKVDPNSMLNNPACAILQSAGTAVRYFNGIVRHVSAEGVARDPSTGDTYQIYKIILVPRFWFLGQTMDCRVYEVKSAADILSAMFNDASLTDVSSLPSATQRPYTVQYNESDLHFATRLMEEEGWYYFHQHAKDKHTLVVTNQNGAFTTIPNATLYIKGGADGAVELLDFKQMSATARGKQTYRDYDPTKPDALLQNSQNTTLTTGGTTQRDYFHWPALTYDNGVVTDRAKREMEAAEAAASLYDGTSRYGALVPGGKFTISSKPASAYDGEYVVRTVRHQVTDDTWMTGSTASSYINHFVAFPSATTWRQPMVTPRPRMEGVHSALVLGQQHGVNAAIKSQDGEEIYTDDLARVKVRFYWDYRGEATGPNAVWARVIQPWAGKGWGAQFIPRVGTEVAVAFVDGDPDRPIVIGGLYNGRDTPIYLSADKTKSGLRTRSTLSGTTKQFNELTFDDKASSELIFMHAEKDMFTEIENNQTLTVGNDRAVTVTQNETVDIQNNQTITVTQDRAVTVSQGNNTWTISQGNNSLTVSQGNNSVTVSQGNNSLTVSAGNHSETVTKGNYSINVNAGQMTVQAAQSIQLTCGQSSIQLSPSGITISAAQVSITGQSQGSFDGGMSLSLTGGTVAINS
jgi:type VI secretion system secreted protein VgrG